MIYPLDRPRIQVLDPAERHEGVQEPLLLRGKRPAQTVAHKERLAQRAINPALLERGQRHGEVVEPVTVTTVVEIDGAGDASADRLRAQPAPDRPCPTPAPDSSRIRKAVDK